jgi:hypothetical protein
MLIRTYGHVYIHPCTVNCDIGLTANYGFNVKGPTILPTNSVKQFDQEILHT